MRSITRTSMEADENSTDTVANFVLSTLNSLFPTLLSYAIELAKLIPSLASEAWEFVVQKLGDLFSSEKVKLVVTVCVAVAIALVFVKLCCCRRRGIRMMKAPGGGGAIMPRSVFEANPRGYFRNLRSHR